MRIDLILIGVVVYVCGALSTAARYDQQYAAQEDAPDLRNLLAITFWPPAMLFRFFRRTS